MDCKQLGNKELRKEAEHSMISSPAQNAGRSEMKKPPKYCGPHQPSGKAYCWIDGKQKYLPGHFGSPESVAAYRRVLSAFSGKRPLPDPDQCTVAELFDLWFAEHDGIPPKKYSHYCRCAAAILESGHASRLVQDFGPRALREVRDLMVDQQLARSTVNQRIGRIKKVFKWGVSQEMVPVAVMQALYTVEGLTSKAKPPQRIVAVDWKRVEELKSLLSDTVYSMLRVLWLTGMRPDNLCKLKLEEIDRSDDVWLYTPEQHKTKYRGHGLVIALGPKTQKIILKCQKKRSESDYVFRPADSLAWHAKNNSMFKPWNARTPADNFSPNTLRQALLRAQAHKAGIKVKRALPTKKDFVRVGWNYFTVYQLRHAAATELRQSFSVEEVRAYLGHSTLSATEVYAEHDLASAKKIAISRG